MQALRQGIAAVLGVVMWLAALVVALYSLTASIGIGSDSLACADTTYACFSRVELVLIGSGLALLGLAAAGLFGVAGVALSRYAASESPRWRWRIAATALGGTLLAFGWAIGALYYWGSTGAFS
jgi:hypothetical protein